MIRRLDEWLIDKPFQTMVDIAQRQPAWMVRQCALAGALLAVVRQAAEADRTLWVTVTIALCGLTMAAFTFLPGWVAAFGSLFWLRVANLIFPAVSLASLIAGNERAIPWFLSDLLSMGVWYFAACRPPKPREPRRKMAGAGGAA